MPTEPNSYGTSRRSLLRAVGGGALGLGVAGVSRPAVAAEPTAMPDPVPRWISGHAHGIASTVPDAAPVDLEPLRTMIGDVAVVGLGESTHGAHEQLGLKHRLVRFLVERAGFRSVVLEEDWTKGIQIDEFLRHGRGDPRDLLADAGTPWQCREILDLLVWMREYNERHPTDPVRFAGADVVSVRALAYDAVTDHVARRAPRRLADLSAHYDVIRPAGAIGPHIAWYRGQPDKKPYIDHARAARDLVASLPADPGRRLAPRHAEAIVGFHEYHATSAVAVRDRYMADTVAFWRGYTGGRSIYWASNVHSACGDPLTISYPPFPPSTQTSAGGILRRRYGDRYLSVAMTFDHGEVNAGYPLQRYAVPPPAAQLTDTALAPAAAPADYLLDLRAPAPPAVRSWLRGPAVLRAVGPSYDPASDASYFISGGSLRGWFDVLVHQGLVTATTPL
ncbi:erythromycin esterase [Parafrankia irregularis]|uniref:Erythromycin esterase n=1 Tax=Parafrankia irregularis TaxID=795642 RepID=A0A0S4QEE7_9ACTN|nr:MULTISPECIES: erythromycin esterase family protein [Parafrankia]MBE3199700.1 erythromycin esterase family protein [Parafrankia sp. CH37]CUU53630.1 erythromycin esterase [Parafrankia irregularis]